MSLMSTKPTWHRGECIATERGWVNPANNEVLVAIGNLKAKLEAEGVDLGAETAVMKPVKVAKAVVTEEPKKHLSKKERKAEAQAKNESTGEDMNTPAPNTDAKDAQVVAEVVENDPAKQIIAEVVEYKVATPVITE